MKTAIYIEDGVVQLVITPESKFEKDALKSFSLKPFKAEMFSGSFYDCRGGWTRYRYGEYADIYGTASSSDSSLILRVGTSDE